MSAPAHTSAVRFNHEAGLGLGISQICIGAVCVICGIALFAGCLEYDKTINDACGLWSGAYYIITGILGILTWRTKQIALDERDAPCWTRSITIWRNANLTKQAGGGDSRVTTGTTNLTIIAFMIFSIGASMMAWATVVCGARNIHYAQTYVLIASTLTIPCTTVEQIIGKVCGSLLIVCGLVAFVVAVISTLVCCPCGGCDQSYAAVHPAPPGTYPGPPRDHPVSNQAPRPEAVQMMPPKDAPINALPANGLEAHGQTDQRQVHEMLPVQGQGYTNQPPEGYAGPSYVTAQSFDGYPHPPPDNVNVDATQGSSSPHHQTSEFNQAHPAHQ